MSGRTVKSSIVLAAISLFVLGIAPGISAQISGPIEVLFYTTDVNCHVTAIAVAPGGNPIYVGTFDKGVLRIDPDTGQSEDVNDGLENLGIRSLVIDPSDPSRIYASLGTGVFRSEDKGRHWVKISQSLGRSVPINGLWISPLNPDILLAQASLGGVFRTDDGGNNWRSLYIPAIDHGSNYGTKMVVKKDGSTIYALKAGVPVRRSRDSGETWADMIFPPNACGDLALSANEKVIYMGSCQNVSDEQRVVAYRSLDEGDTWEGLESDIPHITFMRDYISIHSCF